MGEGPAGLRTFWLIVGKEAREGAREGGLAGVFELGAEEGDRVLPVFGFEEEALLFLRLGGMEGRWRASETTAADLASALTGAYSRIGRVVLDPFPEVGFDGFYEALSLRRERFVDLLANPLGR